MISFFKKVQPANAHTLFEIILVYFAAIALFRFLRQGAISLNSQFLHIVLYYGTFVYLPVFVVLITRKDYHILSLGPMRKGREIKLLAVSSLMVFVLVTTAYFLSDFWWTRLAQYDLRAHKLPAVILHQIVVVAFSEEFFFRGYLQTRIEGRSLNYLSFSQVVKIKSVYLSAVLFALFHYLVGFSHDAFFVFLPGLLFAFLRVMSGGIFVPVLIHALCNILSILLVTILTQ
jgi:membrane protease YdiL (CAAX protease family)